MKILITGVSGFLGGEISGILSKKHEIVGISHKNGQNGLISADFRDEKTVKDVLMQEKPDLVIHAAAYRDPDFCEENSDEAERLNVQSTKYILDNLDTTARMIFISSDYVFDGKTPPHTEATPVNPINVYGETKIKSEVLTLERKNALVLRVPLLMGSDQDGRSTGFLAQMKQAIEDEIPIELDHVLVRYPTWTRDVAHALDYLITENRNGIYHFSGLAGGTRYSWTREMAYVMGRSSDHIAASLKVIPRAAARPADSQLGTDKIRGEGYNGFSSFPEVVRSVLSSVQ